MEKNKIKKFDERNNKVRFASVERFLCVLKDTGEGGKTDTRKPVVKTLL